MEKQGNIRVDKLPCICNNDSFPNSDASAKLLYTPNEMKASELERLENGQWLSDDIVNFALQYVPSIPLNLLSYVDTRETFNASTRSENVNEELFWVPSSFFLPTLR